MTGHAFDAGEKITGHVGLQERRSERKPYVAPFEVDRNALHMECALLARIYLTRQSRRVYRQLRGSMPAAKQKRECQRHRRKDFSDHDPRYLSAVNIFVLF